MEAQTPLSMPKVRADLLIVARGLAESRTKARAAIEASGVRADGRLVKNPSDLLSEDVVLEVAAAHSWVSRGGIKLAHALDTFSVSAAGRVCLDVGASTGGFTQVLIARGAKMVYAVDVGRRQLHASLLADPRVVNLEQTDARALTPALIADAPSLIVCDVSFIGAAKALAVPLSLAAEHAELVALIKPHFEAGPNASKNGVLDEATARSAADAAIRALDGLAEFWVLAIIESPIRGGDGNLEFLMHAARGCVAKRPGSGRGVL